MGLFAQKGGSLECVQSFPGFSLPGLIQAVINLVITHRGKSLLISCYHILLYKSNLVYQAPGNKPDSIVSTRDLLVKVWGNFMRRPIFALKFENSLTMEQQVQVNTKKHWALFFFWLIVISIMLYLPGTRPWFWLVLPFVCTEFAKAMDIM